MIEDDQQAQLAVSAQASGSQAQDEAHDANDVAECDMDEDNDPQEDQNNVPRVSQPHLIHTF